MKKRENSPLFAFFGTPLFAVRVLDALERHGYLPTLVITAPDKPRGRGQRPSPAPAKEWAQARGIDVITPATLNDESLVAEFQNTAWDVFIVAAYAKLLPRTVLNIPKHGCLNIHPSLLPKFRGPSPVLSTILEDEKMTGVSIMLMNEQMDHGPIVAQARVEIAPEDWPPKGSVLLDLLATEGGNLLAETIPAWIAGRITPEPQNESQASYTKKFTDEDARLDISSRSNARQNFLKTRAFDAKAFDLSHRAYFLDKNGKRVIVTEADFKDDAFEILKVIPEGKKEMPFKTCRGGRAGTP